MTSYRLSLSSIRAERARLSVRIGKKWLQTTLLFIIGVSVFAALCLLITSQPIGWIVLLPGVLALMVRVWYVGALESLPYGTFQRGEEIVLHEAVDASMLANLKNDKPSIYDVWKALENTEERYFIGNRYLLDASFYENFADQTPGSSIQLWEHANRLRQTHQAKGFTNIILLVAIAKTVPNIDQILKHIQLDMDDVETSIPWMHDVLEKRAIIKSKKGFGGIGRDWAYGYTPILQWLGHNISQGIEMHGFFSDTSIHEPIVQQMTQTMGSGAGTVTLVGETGVGKTTCVYAFAERLLADGTLPERIRYNQVVELDAPSLIANAKNPGQLEELMLRIFSEARKAKNIILFFDDAEAFFGTGTGAVDLSHVLQPAFESSNIRLVLAMTPQSWQRLSGSGVAARLKPVNVPPANQYDSLSVLRDAVSIHEYRHGVVYTYQSLHEAYKLGGRYVTHLAMPGAALSVLEQTAVSTQQQLITREEVQACIEQTYGIKLQQASGDESTKLLSLEEQLHKYVINQDRAVTVVADALRRSRSGVGNPNRPVGTFLFLGPTGVGKTELSKALARVYFGSESAMIRVDMNQYVQSTDVSRLIQPMIGSELGFLGEVRKKPFSVILLDEIEKAHGSVVNALLQMLDEGVMRDSDNKPVSFKDAIIIATSNAGADEIRRMIDEGENIDESETKFIETLINRGSFAPEFVNRFDEVVIFKPLTQDELTQVIDLIIDGINMTLDAQKVRVVLSEPAKRWLVEKGYDSRLGARPMRRMAQRYVENIIAKRLLDQSVQSGGVINLDVTDFESNS